MLPSLRTRFETSDEEAQLMKLENVAGAVFGIKCGQLEPDKLSRFYASEFVRLGGRMVLNTNVKELFVDPKVPLGIEGEPFVWQESEIRRARLEGGIEGEIKAETIVIANGCLEQRTS